MRVVPRNTVPQIEYFKTHLPIWLERAAEIGTTLEQVEQLQETVLAAVQALKERDAAELAARSATLRLKNAQKAMFKMGRGIIQQVHAKATMEGGGIYARASVSPPSDGGPLEAPATPTQITHTIDTIGAITLKWKCKQPTGAKGTTYQVSRCIDEGPMVWIGMTGDKKFVDETVPQGSRNVMYQLQATRSTGVGSCVKHNVPLGSVGIRTLKMFQTRQKRATLYAA